MKEITTLPEAAQGKVPKNVMEELKTAIQRVEAGLFEQDPEMRNHLRESHKLLLSYPETVHLLDDEEIRSLIDAQIKLTNTMIVSEVAKKTKTSKTKLGVSDL